MSILQKTATDIDPETVHECVDVVDNVPHEHDMELAENQMYARHYCAEVLKGLAGAVTSPITAMYATYGAKQLAGD